MNGEWGLRTGPGRCFPVFPKVDTPYGQALTGLKVQAPLGARVLSFVCCAPNDGFSPQSGLVQRGILYAAAWGSENHTTALRARKCIPPLVAGAPTFPPQFGGAAKGKRLNGQARRLTSPHLEVLCRTSTGDYKTPLCCELLMKGLLFKALLSHRSAGGRWCRKAPKGESHRRWLIDVMLFVTYDADRLIRNADFISIARKGNPQPFEPACQRQAEPFEPSEPGPLCGPIGDTTTLGLKGRQT